MFQENEMDEIASYRTEKFLRRVKGTITQYVLHRRFCLLHQLHSKLIVESYKKFHLYIRTIS